MTKLRVEKIHGLPEQLPPGENLLWQGRPEFWSTLRHVFHADKVAIYFALLACWSVAASLNDGASFGSSIVATAGLLPVVGLALALLGGLAGLTCRSTIYSVTTKRVVMHYGIALPMTVNLAFSHIESADLKYFSDGTGDLCLTLSENKCLGYFHLWPHVRRWHMADPKPTLRSIGEPAAVADLLAKAANHSSSVLEDTVAPSSIIGPVSEPAAA